MIFRNQIPKSILFFLLIAAISGKSALIAQLSAPYGISFPGNSLILPFEYPNRYNLEFSTYQGGMVFYSPKEETARGNFDGGIGLMGNPINIILASHDGPSPYDQGVFGVWNDGAYWNTNGTPLFEINGKNGITTFNSTNVKIENGTLTVMGSSVLTQANSTAHLQGQGFIRQSDFASLLSLASPPTSAAWVNYYLPRGNVSNAAYFALGNSTASGNYSIARGVSSVASQAHASASGVNAIASGQYASAHGFNVTASAGYAFSSGLNTSAKSVNETVFGRDNIESNQSSPLIWNDLDGLFRVGNGNLAAKSDALTVLKNGQTTLTNKHWKSNLASNPSAALADPPSSLDSGGNALVVDGHTILNGKVKLSVPQGDISMGIYGN